MIGLLGFAAIWGAGYRFGWPAWRIWAATLIWWLFALIAHFPFQAENPLQPIIGGDFNAWLVFGILVGVAGLYWRLLRFFRQRAGGTATEPAAVAGPFRAAELDRYARHIMLREIGGPGQKRLNEAKVLVVGAGGLGSPALMYLAASGVGVIGVIDGDAVENSNLQRQIIHTDQRIGMPKVFSAEVAMKALNPFITVRPYHRHLDEGMAADLIADYDLVLDGTDNFDTRYLLNQVCVDLRKPLISGAITQWEGQVSLFDPAKGSPCYECIFPVRPAPGLVPSCAEAGVAAPLPGVIGAMMAMEAVKQITGAGASLMGRLMIHDALFSETRVISVKARADCPVCGAGSNPPEALGQA
jgi:molybdopterin/thiamine biosynthesis adenylyltransferase